MLFRSLRVFPTRLPDRVRSNYTVAMVGIRLWCSHVGRTPPEPNVLQTSLKTVFDTDIGRAPIAADEMVEDLANAAGGASHTFTWDYDPGTRTFWFQFGSGYTYWLALRRRTGRDALGRDALRNQLGETEYIRGPEARGGSWMYGVDLAAAKKFGLDIADTLDSSKLEVRF